MALAHAVCFSRRWERRPTDLMVNGWQDSWTFRIVDQETGAAIPGVPVTVLDDGGRSAGFWVSDVDGIVRIPKHDRPRLRLRVGLRSEDTIELDARSLPDDPVPLIAPHGGVGTEAPTPEPPVASAPGQPGHVVRFARIGLSPEDQDLAASPAPESGPIRYGVLLEVEQIWQSLGSQAGDLLYSVALGPGDEARVSISDGRWRKKPDWRERPLQIVGKMIAARVLGDGMDAVPLEAFVVPDLQAAAAETVRYLAQRTVRMTESLRGRPLGVNEVEGAHTGGGSLRTVRNMRSDGVLTYHFVEPIERYRVIVRTPRLRPAILVPFRLPNLATRDVVRRFGYALKRALRDRAFLPDLEHVVTADAPAPEIEARLYAHIAANLPYYSATIIAAGDPAERFFALAKLRDAEGRVLTDLIENTVVGRVGNYVVFPLRSLEATTPAWRAALSGEVAQHLRAFQEAVVTLPLPGVWLRAQLSPAAIASEPAVEEETPQAAQEAAPLKKRPRA